jgi:diguanylate cyclase (GGDEF)-like protein
MARAQRTKQPLALAFADVDNLKSTNDVFGHATGDQMLREIVNTIRAKLRPYDVIIRYGGDEFVCVISEMDLTEAAARFSLVNTDLALDPDHGSVTVGLAELLPDDLPADLIARADADLYRERDKKRQTKP